MKKERKMKRPQPVHKPLRGEHTHVQGGGGVDGPGIIGHRFLGGGLGDAGGKADFLTRPRRQPRGGFRDRFQRHLERWSGGRGGQECEKCVNAKNAFAGLHALRRAAEGSGDNERLSEKLDEDEELILGAMRMASGADRDLVPPTAEEIVVVISCQVGFFSPR